MSTVAKACLVTAVCFTIGTVVYVHYRQDQDRQRLHEGVIRDIERQRRKKENARLLREEDKLRKRLEGDQNA